MQKNVSPGILKQMPASIWVLGFVSLLMDISSEMVHSLLPMFMVGVLGISVLAVGIIEGLAESTALIVKVFSGAISDYLGKRKPLTLLGYSLGALSKPMFALAAGANMIISARLIDRFGKGIRGAPRDALIADIAPTHLRGAAFGLRQALDTIGAFVGPLLGVGLMLLWANDFRAVFWVSVIPAALAVLLLAFGLKESDHAKRHAGKNPIQLDNLKRMGTDYWWVVAIGAVFTLARFSEAFLVLKSQEAGVAMAYVPLVMVAMNIIYASTAYPFGKLSDRVGSSEMLIVSLLALIGADVFLALSHHWSGVVTGVMLWGIHMAMSQGLLAKMVADTAPADLRGTAYGFFSLLSGIALLLASTIAGLLWQRIGSSATFYAGAAFSLLTLAGLLIKRKLDKNAKQSVD